MEFAKRLYLSTIADDACAMAQQAHLGLEIAEFCTASNMDDEFDRFGPLVLEKMRSARHFVFHAPFNELCPAAIDPLAVTLTRQRYLQAFRLAKNLGISRLVLHTGFIPLVYHEDYVIARSIAFWKALLPEVPEDLTLMLENVMEPGPRLQCAIVSAVKDPRLRLCLDVGHAAAACSKTPVDRWIGPMAPYLSHVHLHNNEGDGDLHQNLGDGILPMADILRQLEAACPEVTYTIETVHTEPSLQFLRTHGFLPAPEKGESAP